MSKTELTKCSRKSAAQELREAKAEIEHLWACIEEHREALYSAMDTATCAIAQAEESMHMLALFMPCEGNA